MPSLGAYNFISLTGAITPPGPVVEPIQRPGVNGTAWRYLGSKGYGFHVDTIAFVPTAADGRSLIINYANLVGSDLVLTDATGQVWGVYVEHVTTRQPYRVLAATLGSGYLVHARWQLRMPGAI